MTGLLALAAGYLILAGAEWVTPEVMPSWRWLIVSYLFFGLGDALVWAPQISLASKLAPRRYAVLLVGGWYVFMGWARGWRATSPLGCRACRFGRCSLVSAWPL